MKQSKTIFLLAYLFFNLGSCKDTTVNSGIITDSRDNKTYKTIKIGEQWWMAENLAATQFNDGTKIPFVTSNEEWVTLESPAYSWYSNDETTYKNSYGGLYNWYAIVCCDICPKGWRIPTDEDWKILEKEIGLTKEEVNKTGIRGNGAGGILKSNEFWNQPNIDASNSSGFTGLPEGHRNWKSGGFVDMGLFGTWWSSTEQDSTTAWRRTLHFNDSNIRRFTSHKRDGFSVRCIKN